MFFLNADTLNLTSCAFSCTNLATQDLATRVCKHQTWEPEPRPGVEPIRLRVSGSGFTWPALGKRQTRMARCSNGFRLCLGLVGFGFSVYGLGLVLTRYGPENLFVEECGKLRMLVLTS